MALYKSVYYYYYYYYGAERTDDGSAFHARAAVTEKARSPTMPAGCGYLTEGIEWIDAAEVTDAGRLDVLRNRRL